MEVFRKGARHFWRIGRSQCLHSWMVKQCLIANSDVMDEITPRTAKSRAVFVNMRHSWGRYDIRLLSVKECTTPKVCSVLSGCETWHLCGAFDHRFAVSTARTWWKHRVGNDKVRHRALYADGHPPSEVITLHRLRWHGRALPMSAYCMPAEWGYELMPKVQSRFVSVRCVVWQWERIKSKKKNCKTNPLVVTWMTYGLKTLSTASQKVGVGTNHSL